MSDWKAGDAVWVHYGGNQVGHILSEEEAERANNGLPVRTTQHDTITKASEIHFYSDCGGVDRRNLSWSTSDTTCDECLIRRAGELRGWRWAHEFNCDEVAFLKQRLGSKVDGFEEASE